MTVMAAARSFFESVAGRSVLPRADDHESGQDPSCRLLVLRVREPGVGAVAPVFVPAGEGGAVFGDVGDAPAQAALVEVGGDGVVGAEDVEVAGGDAGDHAVYDLLGGPGAGGFLAVGCYG